MYPFWGERGGYELLADIRGERAVDSQASLQKRKGRGLFFNYFQNQCIVNAALRRKRRGM